MKAAAITDFAQFATLRAEARSESPQALRKTAQQFEGLMLQQMLKSMRAASLGEDVLGGEQTQFYQEMFDQQLAQHLSAGKGLGIADLLVRQLQQRDAAAQSTQGLGPLPPPRPAVADGARSAGAAPRGVAASGTEAVADTPADFVRAILPHAEKAAAELGIPANVLVAQAALETGWGRHAMRRDDGGAAFNLFGIKADPRWQGDRVEHLTHEYDNGEIRRERAQFRAYASVAGAFDDYVSFLKSNPRYAQALQHGGDAERFASGLQKAGYATDPAYAQKILRIADGDTLKQALAQRAAAGTYTV